jgi:hypothetical protein
MINPNRINEIIRDCLFNEEEVRAANGNLPEGCVKAISVRLHLGFHPGRLESHRKEVREMLMELPITFRKSVGGGWSFLNACTDKDGNMWGQHRDIDELLALGIALGYISFSLPREFWPSLPGGMPYFTFDDLKT